MDGDIWLDPSISLNHYGSFCFQGNPEMIIQFNNDVPLTTKKVQAAEETKVEEEWEEIDIEKL